MKAENDAIVMHCLPAYRSKEIADEVIGKEVGAIKQKIDYMFHKHFSLFACSSTCIIN